MKVFLVVLMVAAVTNAQHLIPYLQPQMQILPQNYLDYQNMIQLNAVPEGNYDYNPYVARFGPVPFGQPVYNNFPPMPPQVPVQIASQFLPPQVPIQYAPQVPSQLAYQIVPPQIPPPPQQQSHPHPAAPHLQPPPQVAQITPVVPHIQQPIVVAPQPVPQQVVQHGKPNSEAAAISYTKIEANQNIAPTVTLSQGGHALHQGVNGLPKPVAALYGGRNLHGSSYGSAYGTYGTPTASPTASSQENTAAGKK